MAFANRIGNLFKQAVNTNPSVYQAIQCMSSSRLFVGGLSYATDEQTLREAFNGFGDVTEARVIMDRETGRSRGFGFVTFTSSEEASNAMSGMDGQELQGRTVKVNYATERTGGFRGSSYGGDSGAYGGGNSYNAGGGGGYGGSGSGYGGDSYNAGGGGGYGGSGSGYDGNMETGSYGGNASGTAA